MSPQHCFASPHGGGPPQSGTHSPLSHSSFAAQQFPTHILSSGHTPEVVPELPSVLVRVVVLVTPEVPVALSVAELEPLPVESVPPIVPEVVGAELDPCVLSVVVPAVPVWVSESTRMSSPHAASQTMRAEET